MAKYWTESPSELLRDYKIMPFSSMTLPEQINAMTRLVIVIFLALFLIDFPYSFHFVIISILFLIILCYIQRNSMSVKVKENYNRTDINSPYVQPGIMGKSLGYTKLIDQRPEGKFQWNGLGPGVTNYGPANLGQLAPTKTVTASDGKKYLQSLIQTPQALTFCNDEISIDPPSSSAVSLNQNLARGANPVTKIAPIVLPPSHDLGYWRDNNLIVHSAINSEGIQKDMYLSGYAESTCCGYLGDDAQLVPLDKDPQGGKKMSYIGGQTRENYSCPSNLKQRGQEQDTFNDCKGDLYKYPNKKRAIVSPTPVEDRPYIPSIPVNMEGFQFPYEKSNKGQEQGCPIQTQQGQDRFNDCKGDLYKYPSPSAKSHPSNCRPFPGNGKIISPTPVEDLPYIPSVRVRNPEMPVVEGYTPITIKNPNKVHVEPNRPGWVNTECGYNPEQVYTSSLPSNLPAGNCEQNPILKRYNENLFTQTVTPGVYTRSQVNEPINSNIGISFQQQFEPVSCSRDDKGLHYLQHDPRLIEPVEIQPVETYTQKANYDNVFDPRFYGYGTSYRSYLDPVTGQPRFMYDDVDAIRHPNYIVRSKIDFLPYADSYGPVEEGSEMGNIHNPHIRALAQDSWMRDSLQFRNDLSERRMRKINSEAWQQRSAPLGARMVGSYKK